MVAPQHRRRRRRFTLIVIIVAAATLITLDFSGFGPLATIQSGAREVVTPLRSGGERLVSPITNLWNGATGYDELVAENEELRAEVDELRGEIVQSAIDRDDYEALLETNGLADRTGLPLALGRVRTGTVGNFSIGVVEIDLGSTDGVMVDMAVITPAGVVGRVEQVDRTSSQVRLVSSRDFVMGVEVVGEVGLARGTGSTSTVEIQQGISNRADIEVGDPVTTTSSERTLFPPNLVIGTVSRAIQSDDAANQNVLVELAADPSDLHFVSVVLIEPGLDKSDAGNLAESIEPEVLGEAVEAEAIEAEEEEQ